MDKGELAEDDDDDDGDGMYTVTNACMHAYRQKTDRQTDRQTNRQTDRQTDRQ